MEDDLGAADVGFHRAGRAFDDEEDADGRGEVEHDVGVIHHLGHEVPVGDAVDHVVKVGRCLERLEVGRAACGEVVEDVDFVATGEQLFGHVGADEPGATGYEISHGEAPSYVSSGRRCATTRSMRWVWSHWHRVWRSLWRLVS